MGLSSKDFKDYNFGTSEVRSLSRLLCAKELLLTGLVVLPWDSPVCTSSEHARYEYELINFLVRCQ